MVELGGKICERGIRNGEIRFSGDGGEIEVPTSLIFEKLGVQNIIRIPEKDYPQDAKVGDVLVHFGLPIPGEPRGTKVALAKILENGYFTKSREENLPLLSLNNIWIAEVKNCIESVSYEFLPDDCFENTIGGVRNDFELKDLIINRYSRALPDHSEAEILAQEVSVRYLSLITRTSYQ